MTLWWTFVFLCVSLKLCEGAVTHVPVSPYPTFNCVRPLNTFFLFHCSKLLPKMFTPLITKYNEKESADNFNFDLLLISFRGLLLFVRKVILLLFIKKEKLFYYYCLKLTTEEGNIVNSTLEFILNSTLCPTLVKKKNCLLEFHVSRTRA